LQDFLQLFDKTFDDNLLLFAKSGFLVKKFNGLVKDGAESRKKIDEREKGLKCGAMQIIVVGAANMTSCVGLNLAEI
jgi:hypothetical protein